MLAKTTASQTVQNSFVIFELQFLVSSHTASVTIQRYGGTNDNGNGIVNCT